MTDPHTMRRRTVLGGAAALGAGLPLLGGVGVAHAATPDGAPDGAAATRRAVSFLQRVTDAFRATGPRLAQSYQDASGPDRRRLHLRQRPHRHRAAGRWRRRAGPGRSGTVSWRVQEADGRLRQAYLVGQDPPVPAANFGFTGTAVGDMAWTGLALAQLARATGVRRYLDGLVKIGTWIQDNAYSTTGLGGYEFGLTPGLEGFKSAEHNIDVYALFRLLARLTGDQVVEPARRARLGLRRADVERRGRVLLHRLQRRRDHQQEPDPAAAGRPDLVLAGRPESRYAAALDWAATNLATTDTPLRKNSTLTGNDAFTGVAFASGSLLTDTDTPIADQSYNPKPDDSAVWFEGTAQLALALRDRRRGDDRDDASELLDTLRVAQQRLGQGQTFNGRSGEGGVVAASSPMDTGFGFGYFPNLHIGATSWFVMASLNANPYRFL